MNSARRDKSESEWSRIPSSPEMRQRVDDSESAKYQKRPMSFEIIQPSSYTCALSIVRAAQAQAAQAVETRTSGSTCSTVVLPTAPSGHCAYGSRQHLSGCPGRRPPRSRDPSVERSEVYCMGGTLRTYDDAPAPSGDPPMHHFATRSGS